MKIKELSKNLSLLFITLLVFFSLLEVGIRLFVPESKRAFEFNEIVGHKRILNLKFKERTEEFGLITHYTNSSGFVDSEHKLEKDEDIYRILFLGDSFTEAVQVPLDKTFCKILESKLNSLNLDKKFETINVGLSSLATDQEYLVLKEFGLKYNPDLVILMFYAGNDVHGNSLTLSNASWKPYFDLRDGFLIQVRHPQPIGYNKFISFIIKHFQSPRFLYKKIKHLQGRLENLKHQFVDKDSSIPEGLNLLYSKEYDSDWEKAWQITMALIKEIGVVSKKEEADFLLVSLPQRIEVIPTAKELGWDLEKPSRILKEFFQEIGIDYLDLLPLFREHVLQTGEEIYGDHFNSNGHKLIAELIYNFLITNSLIKI